MVSSRSPVTCRSRFSITKAGQFKWAELQASDALLLGRKTYEGFAAAWPTMPGTGEFGEKMNSMTKYVVSSTLDKVEWTGSKLVKGDVASEMRKLKKEPGKNLLLSGSAQLLQRADAREPDRSLPIHGASDRPRRRKAPLRRRRRRDAGARGRFPPSLVTCTRP